MAGRLRRLPFFLCHAMSGVPGHTWKPSHERVFHCVYTVSLAQMYVLCIQTQGNGTAHCMLSYSSDCFIPALLTVLSEPSDKAADYSISHCASVPSVSCPLSFFVYSLQYALIFHEDSKLACVCNRPFSSPVCFLLFEAL